jgi:hypothetical protein
LIPPNLVSSGLCCELRQAPRYFYTRKFRREDHKTGISGLFDFHLEYATDDGPGAAPWDGLDLYRHTGATWVETRTDQGPDEFLVIDHVERPSAN